MRILALYNLKGGVGKTSAAVNLAALAAAEGQRTLLWDLDAQGGASFLLGIDERPVALKRLLDGSVPVGKAIQSTYREGLDVLPMRFSARHLDERLALGDRARAFSNIVSILSERYRLLVLDCPPTAGALAEQIFTIADRIVFPMVPSPLALNSWQRLQDNLRKTGLDERKAIAFLSMVDRHREQHRRWLYQPPPAMMRRLLPYVPYSDDVENMGYIQRAVVDSHPHCASSAAYRRLWRSLSDSTPER